jgi:hypothetical protein
MSQKYDIPNIYIGELTQYQSLFLKGNNRTSSGSGSFISPSSSLTYTYTGGENDLFSQLQTFLNPYLITANDFNLGVSQYKLFEMLLSPDKYQGVKFDTPNTGDITEEIRLKSNNSLYANFVTQFDTPNSGDITTTLECDALNIHTKTVTEFDTLDGFAIKTSGDIVVS